MALTGELQRSQKEDTYYVPTFCPLKTPNMYLEMEEN